jgi:hypothetical protein
VRGSIYIFCLLVKGGAQLGMYQSYHKGTILVELSWGTLESGVPNGKPPIFRFPRRKRISTYFPKDLQPSRKATFRYATSAFGCLRHSSKQNSSGRLVAGQKLRRNF